MNRNSLLPWHILLLSFSLNCFICANEFEKCLQENSTVFLGGLYESGDPMGDKFSSLVFQHHGIDYDFEVNLQPNDTYSTCYKLTGKARLGCEIAYFKKLSQFYNKYQLLDTKHAVKLNTKIQSSDFNVVSLQTVPSMHVSSSIFKAAYCVKKGKAFIQLLVQEYNFDMIEEKHLVSYNKWNLFMHNIDSVVYGYNLKQLDSSKYISNIPSYVISAIGWHPGHFIIDVFEPLYYALKQPNDLGVNDDVQLYLDISQDHQRLPYLYCRIIQDVYFKDTIFQLLRLFSKHLIRSKAALDELVSESCMYFEEIHLQLDVSESYIIHGYKQQPHIVEEPHDAQLFQRYENFQNFIHGELFVRNRLGLNVSRSTSDELLRITIIDRTTSRRVVNLKEIYEAILKFIADEYPELKVDLQLVSLEKLSFTEQLEVLHSTDILIAQQGSGAHNVLFMRPKSQLILLMQPNWCEHRWQFVNQALLARLNVFTYCSLVDRFHNQTYFNGITLSQGMRFHKQGWLQGAWYSKDSNSFIHIPRFLELLRSALEFYILPSSSQFPTHNLLTVSNKVEQASAGRPSTFVAFIASMVVVEAPDVSTVKVVPEILYDGASSEGLVVDNQIQFKFCMEIAAIEMAFPISPTELHFISGRAGKPVKASTVCTEHHQLNEFSTLDFMSPKINPKQMLHSYLVDVRTGQRVADSDSYQAVYLTTLPQPSTCLTDNYSLLVHQQVDCESLTWTQYFFTNEALTGRHVAFNLNVDGALSTVEIHFNHSAYDSMYLVGSSYCRMHRLSANDCHTLAYYILNYSYKEAVSSFYKLPLIQIRPSSTAPFVFLHLEKTAGTCLRYQISRHDVLQVDRFVSPDRKYPAIIPCHGGIRCDQFFLSQCDAEQSDSRVATSDAQLLAVLHKGAAIIAGHFQWGVWQEHKELVADYSCFTMIRHPVSRAISLYYERVYPHDRTKINDLTPEKLQFYIQKWRGSAFSRYRDEGFSDANCKMFSGANMYKGRTPEEVAAQPADYSLSLSKERLAQCVVGLQEDYAASKRVLGHWFPWLHLSGCPRGDQGGNEGHKGVESVETLRPELLQLLLQANQCDMALYDYALSRFRMQIKVLDARI